MFVMGLRYPNAKILNAYQRLVSLIAQGDDEGIRLGRVLDGIGEQIDEDLPQAVPIPQDRCGDMAGAREMMSRSGSLDLLHDVVEQVIQVHQLLLIRKLIGLDFGKVEHVS